MNALNWLTGLAQKLDFGLNGLGKEFRNVASFFLRLSLLILFFWYFAESASILWANHAMMSFTLATGGAVLLVVFVVITIRGLLGFERANAEDKQEEGGIFPYLLLNLPFVVAVALADSWYGHGFSGGLLGFTQYA